MLSKIELTNFQSHNATHLEFHAGVNAIVGPSDKGKSAILRGIYWVLTNRPSGVAVVSDWARDAKGKILEECSVVLHSAKGTVKRLRTNDVNGYEIGGERLEAVGVAVPEEVTAFLNIGEVNVQRQMDPPFMLGVSAGEVARFLNSSVKLDAIDDALSVVAARKKSTTAELKAATAALKERTDALEALAWVEPAEALVAQLQALEAERASTAADLEAISGQAQELHRLQGIIAKIGTQLPKIEELLECVLEDAAQRDGVLAQLARLPAEISNLRTVQATLAKVQDTTAAEGLLEELSRITAKRHESGLQLNALSSEVAQYRRTIEAAAKVDTAPAEELLEWLADKVATRQAQMDGLRALIDDMGRIRSFAAVIRGAERTLATLQEQLEELQGVEVELAHFYHCGSDQLFIYPANAPRPHDDGNLDQISPAAWHRKAKELFPHDMNTEQTE